MKLYRFTLFGLICIGIIARLYLALTLPAWHDEIYSVWAGHSSFLHIIQGSTDPVHPPGYYVLLKVFSYISDHLVWYRLISILLSIGNMALIYKFAKDILPKQKMFALLCVFLYSCSGYFILFDWQVRMYTGLTTCILASYIMHNKIAHDTYRLSDLILFTAINVIGLYVDYGFMWYILPLTLISFITALAHKPVPKTNWYIFTSITASGLIFACINMQMFFTYQQGIHGISWVKSFLSPSYLVPFFLGSHQNTFVTILFLSLFLTGTFIWWKMHLQFYRITNLLYIGILAGYSTYIYSLNATPIFHERSLQILAIVVMYIFAIALHTLMVKRYWVALSIIMVCIMYNFLFVVRNIPVEPERYLISFFPWKQIKTVLEAKKSKHAYLSPHKNMYTRMLLEGLTYTLQGKETLFSRPIPYTIISENTPIPGYCERINDMYISINGCP